MLRPHFTAAAAPIANLERQAPDAIFVRSDGLLILLIELARTDDMEADYWRKRRASKEEKY